MAVIRDSWEAPMCTVRYFAAIKAAAGTGEERVDAATLAGAMADARLRHGDRFSAVLARCSFVVDGDPVGLRDHSAIALGPDAVVEVLPPFAGG